MSNHRKVVMGIAVMLSSRSVVEHCSLISKFIGSNIFNAISGAPNDKIDIGKSISAICSLRRREAASPIRRMVGIFRLLGGDVVRNRGEALHWDSRETLRSTVMSEESWRSNTARSSGVDADRLVQRDSFSSARRGPIFNDRHSW